MLVIYLILAVLIVILIVIFLILKMKNIRVLSNLLVLPIIFLITLEIRMINGQEKFFNNNTAEHIYAKELGQKYLISGNNYGIKFENDNRTLIETANNLSGFAPVYSKLQILENGPETFESMLSEINKAEHHIHIQDFILRDDNIGNKFLNLLSDKSKKGVKVRIIIDGEGISNTLVNKLQVSGIEVIVENPLIKSIVNGTFNNRDHRKIFIIDGKVAFTGGLNVGDEYLSKNSNIGFWRDTDIMLEGEVVRQFQCMFLASWYLNTKVKIDGSTFFPKTEGQYVQLSQAVNSLPMGTSSAVEQIYINMISNAKKSIYIVTPYLVLSENSILALNSALSRGVSIKVIIPSYSDNAFVNRTSHVYGQKLAAANIEVYEYTKGFIHSKIIVIDKSMGSIGTANFNNRSMKLDKENAVLVYDKSTINTLVDHFKQDIKDSRIMIPGGRTKKSILNTLIDKICIMFSPIQ